jgi:uncharacterized protein (TIGR02271 family)
MQDNLPDNLHGVPVDREDGVAGKVTNVTANDDGSTMIVIQFDDGVQVVVSPQMLSRQDNGFYRLLRAASHRALENDLVIPVLVEETVVGTQQVTRGIVRVHKRVETQEQIVDIPISSEEISVERLPINTFVEGEAPRMREEDGVVIIPVLEEILVVEKRVMLREEVRLITRVTSSNVPQTVRLRREVVDVERVEPSGLEPADQVRPEDV